MMTDYEWYGIGSWDQKYYERKNQFLRGEWYCKRCKEYSSEKSVKAWYFCSDLDVWTHMCASVKHYTACQHIPLQREAIYREPHTFNQYLIIKEQTNKQ